MTRQFVKTGMFVFMIMVIGCANTSIKERIEPVYEPIVNGQIVHVEVYFINDYKSPGDSFEKAINTFKKYVAGEVKVLQPQMLVLELGDDRAISKKQFAKIIKGAKYQQAGDITFVIVPACEFTKVRGQRELSYDGVNTRISILINSKRVDDFAKSIPFFSKETIWQMVMTQELGHALGVPVDISHKSGGHCTDPHCIMYPRKDLLSSLSAILHLRVPLDLCDKCQSEIRKAHGGTGGKLRDPNKPYNWREEIIKLNPKNVEIYLLAAAECKSKHNFEGAVEYCNKILEVDDKNTVAYVLRGLCYRNMRENRKAVDDFRKAIELDKANIPSLQELSWLLSTQVEDELRDGKYALKLARRSCELTKWENPLCLRSLAAAYAETGDFISAVKYQIESIEKGFSAKSNEKILDLYKSGKPYRE